MTATPAVVTGAGQGLGAAIAFALSEAGHPVALSDLDGERVEAVAVDIRARGGKAIAVCGNAADEADVETLAGQCSNAFGTLGVWVNNAGISRPAMLKNMSLADFGAVLDVHVRGTFLGIRTAARQMIEGDVHGCILNVTSSAGLQGTIGQINYAAAKGAVTAMTKSAAKELARYGIRTNAVAPVAATPMTETIRTDEKLQARYLANIPLGRFAEPAEVASAFVYLSSPAAEYITGQVLCVDGGLYMAS